MGTKHTSEAKTNGSGQVAEQQPALADAKTRKRGRKRASGEQMLRVSHRGKAYAFYRRCPWDKWWDEFAQATLPNGALKYQTAWSFAKAKAHREQERRWIWAAIGPKPEFARGRTRPSVPWLGDWMKRRVEGFWFGTDKVAVLNKVLKERGDALEAARAVAGVSGEWIKRAQGLANQVDNFFRGNIFLPQLSLKENKQRATVYLSTIGRLQAMHHRAVEEFLLCHGIGKDDISVFVQMAAVSARAGVQGPFDMFAELEKVGISRTALLMAENIFQKSEMFNLPLPLSFDSIYENEYDDAVRSFPDSSSFPALVDFIKKYQARKKPEDHDWNNATVEQLSESESGEAVEKVIREIKAFREQTARYPEEVVQRIVKERWGCEIPHRGSLDLAGLGGYLRRYQRKYHPEMCILKMPESLQKISEAMAKKKRTKGEN